MKIVKGLFGFVIGVVVVTAVIAMFSPVQVGGYYDPIAYDDVEADGFRPGTVCHHVEAGNPVTGKLENLSCDLFTSEQLAGMQWAQHRPIVK